MAIKSIITITKGEKIKTKIKMNVLVYGSNGWIGQQFLNVLDKEILTNPNELQYIQGKSRVDNYDTLFQEIIQLNPTHIISFIGRTHGQINGKVFSTIDYLEQEGKLVENIRDNLFSPLLLAEISKKLNIHYTYLGTGCIFKYDEERSLGGVTGFTEDSLPNFYGSSYSIVKGFTDRLMHVHKDSVLNLRIRMPITGEQNDRNFITKITHYSRICSIPNSMSVLPELLPIVLFMMKSRTIGTINLTNPGVISHNEILTMYQELVDPAFTWENFSQDEQRKILASDRSNNLLDTIKLETLFPDVRNIKDAVRACLMEYSTI